MANNETTVNASGGIGLPGAVFIVFLILKLAEVGPVAGWSWWWVTAPLWAPLALVAIVLVVVGIVYGIIRLFESVDNRKRRKARSELGNLERRIR